MNDTPRAMPRTAAVRSSWAGRSSAASRRRRTEPSASSTTLGIMTASAPRTASTVIAVRLSGMRAATARASSTVSMSRERREQDGVEPVGCEGRQLEGAGGGTAHRYASEHRWQGSGHADRPPPAVGRRAQHRPTADDAVEGVVEAGGRRPAGCPCRSARTARRPPSMPRRAVRPGRHRTAARPRSRPGASRQGRRRGRGAGARHRNRGRPRACRRGRQRRSQRPPPAGTEDTVGSSPDRRRVPWRRPGGWTRGASGEPMHTSSRREREAANGSRNNCTGLTDRETNIRSWAQVRMSRSHSPSARGAEAHVREIRSDPRSGGRRRPGPGRGRGSLPRT